MRRHLSPPLPTLLLPTFSFLPTMPTTSSSTSSILDWLDLSLQQPAGLAWVVAGRLATSPRLSVRLPTSESRSLEERETGEKGRKEEACEEEGEGSATTRELRKGGWGRKEEVVESVGERMEEVSENISQLGERGMDTGLRRPWLWRWERR